MQALYLIPFAICVPTLVGFIYALIMLKELEHIDTQNITLSDGSTKTVKVSDALNDTKYGLCLFSAIMFSIVILFICYVVVSRYDTAISIHDSTKSTHYGTIFYICITIVVLFFLSLIILFIYFMFNIKKTNNNYYIDNDKMYSSSMILINKIYVIVAIITTCIAIVLSILLVGVGSITSAKVIM